MRIGVAAFAAYVTSILGANWLVQHYGVVSVGFGLTATAGTFAAGAALLMRDVVQDTLGRFAVALGVLGGAALTLWVSPSLAAASATAFLIAELSDMAIYTPLRNRGWARAVIVSNIVGAVLDTFVFLHMAGFPLTVNGVSGQLVGKLLWATLLPVALVVGYRALRQPALRA
jgi:uncharacterized PurR-regulated membrane protein YhhQ (DUF165 family)